MSFLLSTCRELSYGELICLNGGCTQTVYGKLANLVDKAVKKIGSVLNSGGGSSSESTTTVTTSTTVTTVSTSGICTGSGSCSGSASNNFSAVYKSILSNQDQRYLITGNKKTEYRCDQWAEEVLTEAGFDAEKLLCGSSQETVAEHISKLEEGSYTNTIPTERGAYLVFMADGKIDGKDVTEHCAILVVESTGKMTIWDNSSGNEVTRTIDGIKTTYKGGVAPTTVAALTSTKISEYCYNKYYFQEIK